MVEAKLADDKYLAKTISKAVFVDNTQIKLRRLNPNKTKRVLQIKIAQKGIVSCR